MKTFNLSVLAAAILCLSACGGSSLETVHVGDNVTSADSGESSPEAAPSVKNDETIVPADPGAPAPSSPSDVSDPAPAAEPDAALSLHLEAEKDFDTRLGLVRLTWNVAGPADEIYLWSAGFNRQAGDQAQEDPCGPIEQADVTRHLLVNSINSPNLGFDLNEGSPAHEALIPYLDSARPCDAANCEGFAESADATPVCRIDLNPSVPAGAFYTRTLVKDAVYRLCAKTAEGTTCVDSSEIQVPTVSIETTSAGAAGEGKIRFKLTYLNAIREMGAPTGCVKDAGASSFSDREGGRGALVALCPIEKTLSPASPAAARRLSFQGTPATADASDVSFRKAARQRIVSNADLNFSAYGIGTGNADTVSFDIDLSAPVVTLKSGGAVVCDDPTLTEAHCSGRVDLLAEARRDFDVFEHGAGSEEKILHGTISPGAPIGLSSNQGPVGAVSVEAESETEIRFHGVPRNHSHYQWRASVTLGGETYKSSWWKEPRFVPEFQLLDAAQTLHPSNWDTCEYEDTDDGESECGACVETNGFYQATVHWEGRHLKRIGAYCTSANEGMIAVDGPVTIPNTYEKQGSLLGGPALAFQVPVNRSNWSDELVCVLTGEAYDGTKILKMQTWRPNCGYTHAAAGDPYDPDLEGAFIENGTGWANQSDLWALVSSQWDGE